MTQHLMINYNYLLLFFSLWRTLTDTHFPTFSPVNLSIVNIRQCLQCRVPTYSLHGFNLGRCLEEFTFYEFDLVAISWDLTAVSGPGQALNK